MKLFSAILTSTFLVLFGCQTRQSTCEYQIDFQGGFQETLVVLSIDSLELFRGILTTDFSEGFAGSILLNNLVSCDVVEVEVGLGENKKAKTIELTGKYIAVYINEGELDYKSYDKPLFYE